MSRPPGTPSFSFFDQVDDEEWVDFAVCDLRDAYLFQQSTYQGETKDGWLSRLRTARELCWVCPVAGECLSAALNKKLYGQIRGGMALPESRPGIAVEIEQIPWRPHSLPIQDREEAAEEPVGELMGAVA